MRSVLRAWAGGGLLAGLLLAPFILPAGLDAQQREITGQVTRAESGQPLVGAEVRVIAPVAGTSVLSVEAGRFRLQAPTGEVRLQVSAFGYAATEVTVPADQSVIDVALSPDMFRLGELVVTGQATAVDRRNATTSIAYVSGEDLGRVSSPSVMNSLQGRVTGVNLQTNSGAPGGGIQMQVRGNSTLLGGFDPLIVVDGVIFSNASIPSPRGFANNAASPALEADAVNRIADLNPADIESIEILKGAAASSIYGSKASNGVVVITTNRGRAGEPVINVTQRFGVSSPLRLLETRRWTREEAVAQFGNAAAPFFDGNPNPYFDHYGAVYDNRGLSHETLASVSGGTESTRYFVSGQWKHDEGTERGTFATQQSLRMNLDQDLRPGLDISVSAAYARNENDRGWNNNCNNFGCHGYAIAYIPSFVNLEARNPDGSFPRPTVGVQSNPIQLTELGVNHEETNRFTGGANLSWQAMDGGEQRLRFVAGVGVDAFDQRNDVWSPNELFFEQVKSLPGESLEAGGRSLFVNWNANAIHEWVRDGFTASTSFGIQYEDRSLHTFRIRSQNLLPGERNVNQGTAITAVENLTAERTIALYAQEALFLMDDRLLVLAGLRAERSSVNGDIDRFFVFPKASASYRFPGLIGDGSELKLRVAYGETGNQPLFGQKFTNLGTPQIGGQQGITVSTTAGFPDVEPERLQEWEAGIDGEALAGRMTFELTGFTRNTTNLLLQRVPSPSSGFTTEIFNGGEIRNQGIEASLGFTPILRGDFRWVSRNTFTRYTSEVLDLAGLPPFFPAASGFGNLGRTRIEVGRPITQIVGFGEGEDGNITSSLVQLGNSAPDFRMGFINDLTWGPMSFSVVTDWQKGGNVINLTQFLRDAGRTSDDHGTPTWERRDNQRVRGIITPYIEDASFVKVREVALDVAVPREYTDALRLGTRSLRVGLTGRNVFMWTRYSGLDPEVANFGAAAVRNNLDIAPYPPSRSLFFNISVGF
ncbi:MAG: SusC/RagA family TonB-linked outer membrane protein [Gemmatimonadales bacterium]|nr:MAG: SusC/RagA family TonB-linked outer membrane protein [Gemmatimonadales bacterium]